MFDLTSISAALSGIKTALDITKFVKDTNSQIEKGELNVKILQLQQALIEAQGVLLNAKEEIGENREKLRQKQAEIEGLKRSLQETNTKSETKKLPEECIKILEFLNAIPEEDDGATASQIIHYAKTAENKIKYFLDLLEERDFISYLIGVGAEDFYYIKKEGRKYLFEIVDA